MNIGKPYAVRINTIKQGGKDCIIVVFGDNASALKNDKEGYYHFVQNCTDDGLLSITRYPYKRNREDGFLKVYNGMVKVTNEHGIRLLSKYIGEYNTISVRPNKVNGSPAIFYELSLNDRSNFTNMYASRSGKTVDIEEPIKKQVKEPNRYVENKEKIEELYDKVPEAAKKPTTAPVVDINVDGQNPLATIDEIMGEQLKELEVKIKKLQEELYPLLEARLRLVRAKECLKYNCELQKGE